MTEPGNTESTKITHRNFAKTIHERGVVRQEKLRDENIELKNESRIDFLTGLYNKRFFDEEAARLEAEQVRGESLYGVVVMDVDGFKKYANDKYGHPVGDEVLKVFAGVISNSPDEEKEGEEPAFRISDYVARIGGDEFAVLMPNYSPDIDSEDQALKLEKTLIKKLHLEFQKRLPQYPDLEKIGVSVGLAFPEGGDEFADVFKRADKMVYNRKNAKSSER